MPVYGSQEKRDYSYVFHFGGLSDESNNLYWKRMSSEGVKGNHSADAGAGEGT